MNFSPTIAERVSRDDDVTVDSSGSGDGMSPNSDESESRNTANILRFSLYSLGGGTFLLFLLILTLALCLCWARRYSKSQSKCVVLHSIIIFKQ